MICFHVSSKHLIFWRESIDVTIKISIGLNDEGTRVLHAGEKQLG